MVVQDRQLASTLETLQEVERQARLAMETDDLSERDNAVILLRHVTAGRKTVERWIGMRLIKAQKQVAARE